MKKEKKTQKGLETKAKKEGEGKTKYKRSTTLKWTS